MLRERMKDKPLQLMLVEDNRELREILASGLRHYGHTVREVAGAREMDAALREFTADILILDLGLPGEDGIAVARRLRKQYQRDLGIVMVTARARVEERVLGLDTGADLYFVKPVDILELEAALRSLYRRMPGRQPSRWRFNATTAVLTSPNNCSLPLTAQECILLRSLLRSPGANVSRQEIFQALHQPDDQYGDKRLETLISRLRRKMKIIDPQTELPIRARHNLGYAFLADVD